MVKDIDSDEVAVSKKIRLPLYAKLNLIVVGLVFSVTAVFAFGMLWGIPGMFLAIPMTGIIKLIFDNVESLKPWGFLLGDTMPESSIINIKPIIEKIIGKSKVVK
jgi:hypothetical protein